MRKLISLLVATMMIFSSFAFASAEPMAKEFVVSANENYVFTINVPDDLSDGDNVKVKAKKAGSEDVTFTINATLESGAANIGDILTNYPDGRAICKYAGETAIYNLVINGNTIVITPSTAEEGKVIYDALLKDAGKVASEENPTITVSSDTITVAMEDNDLSVQFSSQGYKVLGDINFTKASKSKTAIRTRWNKVDNAEGYIVYRANSANGHYSRLAKIMDPNTTEYRDSNLTPNTKYYYMVKAYVSNMVDGQKEYTKKATDKRRYTTKILLGDIHFEKSSKSTTAIRTRWNKVEGADGYIVYRANSKNGNYSRLMKLRDPNTTEYRDSKLKSKTSYYYKIVAYTSITTDGNKVYTKKSTKGTRYTTK